MLDRNFRHGAGSRSRGSGLWVSYPTKGRFLSRKEGSFRDLSRKEGFFLRKEDISGPREVFYVSSDTIETKIFLS